MAATLTSGQRIPLSQLLSVPSRFQIALGVQAPVGMMFDIACFGVDGNDQLSDDRYFVFYNQTTSPEGAIQLLGAQQGDMQRFSLELDHLPSNIQKLVCTLSIDGIGMMSSIQNGYLRLLENEVEVARFTFEGQHFQQERAVIVAEFYFKESWRLLALGHGFSGGLSALLKHYGGEEIMPLSAPMLPVAAPVVNLSKAVQLEKTMQEKAPHLVNLAKSVNVVLEKKQIQDIVANVVMVMDETGSMGKSYRNGTVQAVIDRISMVAMRMDNNGSLESWFYTSTFKQTPDITLDNLGGYVKKYGRAEGVNNEPPIMAELINRHKNSILPVLIIFVTDGGITKKHEIIRLLQQASHYPIFWQFIGVAGHAYGVLEELDHCSGRVVDNANFFAVDDLAHISDDQLFERMLNEFPDWLKAVKRLGMLK